MEFSTLIHSYACMKFPKLVYIRLIEEEGMRSNSPISKDYVVVPLSSLDLQISKNGMRRRYLSLVAAPGLTEAHLLIYENEAKWASSNPPNSSPSTTPSPSRTSPQLPSSAPLQTIEQFLQADDGSRKGAKYLVRLEGLFYAGINHVGVNGRLSVTAVIKSALGKLVVGSSKSQDLTSSGYHHHQQQKEAQKKDAQQQQKSGAVSSEVAGSAIRHLGVSECEDAQYSLDFKEIIMTRDTTQYTPNDKSSNLPSFQESYISTTSTPGTLKNSTEISMMSSQRPASICGIPSLGSTPMSPNSSNSVNANSPRSPISLGLYFQDGSSTLMSFATPDIMEAWLQVLTAVVATNRSRSGYPNIDYI
ncbi:hypothetical protein ACTXT7_002837 [Hymenolepis weldensis]